MPFGFLALLAAFGTLANSLRSNSASVLIRTLLRCSARPNGGGYLTARPLRELRPSCSFAALTLRGLGCLISHASLLIMGNHKGCPYDLTPHASPPTPHASPPTPHASPPTPHASPPTPHASPPTPHSSPLTPHSSPLTPHSSLLTPHSSLLTPHPSPLTPHPSPLTPHPSLLTPHSSLLTPHSSPLTPHPSPLTPHPSPLTPHSSPLTPHPSPLTPHSSPLTPRPIAALLFSGPARSGSVSRAGGVWRWPGLASSAVAAAW